MLTLRCTAALLKKWKRVVDPDPPVPTAATGDWFVKTFALGRREFFLFASAKTLVSVVTRAEPDFPLPKFIPTLFESLLECGIPEAVVGAELDRLNPIGFAKTNDRRVLGSMNEQVRCLEMLHYRIGDRFDPTISEVRRLLWAMPMSILGGTSPEAAVRAALGAEAPLPEHREPMRQSRTGSASPILQAGGNTRFTVWALPQDAEDRGISPQATPALLMNTSFAKTLDASPGAVAAIMEGFGPLLDAETPIPADARTWTQLAMIAERMAEDNPATAGLLLGATCASATFHRVDDPESLLRAVAAVAEFDSPEAMWQLQLLAHWPFGGILGSAAGQAFGEMRARGVHPRPGFAPKFLNGIASSCDGSGARHIGLFFNAGNGEREAVLLLCKDSWGLKDAIPCFGNLADVDAMFRRPPRGLSYAPCSLDLGRELFGDAAAVGLETGKRLPAAAFLCRQYLGEAPIPLERRKPDLSAYDFAHMTRGPGMTDGTAQLANSSLYGGLRFASDEAYRFIRAHGGGPWLSKDAFESFVREACAVEEADLIRRIAVILEVEALAGRATHTPNDMAARVLEALAGRHVPFGDIPYVRGLARHSAEAVAMNLSQGYRTQNEVNEAALRRDDETWQRRIDDEFDPRDN